MKSGCDSEGRATRGLILVRYHELLRISKGFLSREPLLNQTCFSQTFYCLKYFNVQSSFSVRMVGA